MNLILFKSYQLKKKKISQLKSWQNYESNISENPIDLVVF